MLERGAVPLVAIEIGTKAQVLDLQVERAVHLRQQAVVRRPVDAVVDHAVQAVITRQVAPRMAGEHLEGERLDLGNLLDGDMQAGKLPRHRFQSAHHLEAFADVVVGKPHDLRAAIGLKLDQALGGEQSERLTQRCARYAKPLSQQAFIQPGARRDFAFGDEFAQLIGETDRQRLVVDHRQVHRRGDCSAVAE